MKPSIIALPLAILAGAGIGLAVQDKVTYDDGPFLPGGKYRVHGERPRPAIVTPGQNGAPPSDAIVLFDGSDLSQWRGNKGDATWKVSEGHMEVNGTGPIITRQEFGDVQLHVEFATPTEVVGNSQGRGNSGVFLMGRYEIQVLDSFENDSYPDGQCAALYGQHPPLVNVTRGPGEWQSYDIVFRAPRFEGDEVVSPGRVTMFHNGVLVHLDAEIIGSTTHRALAKYSPHAARGPLQLQDHGNPTRYRNVWVRELGGGE